MATATIISTNTHAKTFKIATLSPDGSDWMQKMRAGANEISNKTQGRVRFKFYPGGVMGDDQAVLRKIKIGQLHGGALGGGSLLMANPDYAIYGLLLTYKNQGEIDYVRQHIDNEIMSGFEKGGFIMLGMAESGFVYTMSSKQAINNVGVLRRQKVWAPTGDKTGQNALRSFGVTAIPLPYGDVLAGLQTGLINTVAMSPIGAIALQWYTQIKYLTDIPLLYSFGTLSLSKKAFTKIKPADQQIVREVMRNTFIAIDKTNKKNNQEALRVLKNSGIKFIKPTASEYLQWAELAENSNNHLVSSGQLNAELVQRVKQLLHEYRQNNSQKP